MRLLATTLDFSLQISTPVLPTPKQNKIKTISRLFTEKSIVNEKTHKILSEYKDLTIDSPNKSGACHDVKHFIETNGPPAY